MNLLLPLIESLIPMLVSEAESLLGTPAPNSPAWITAVVQDVASLLDKLLPAWIKPSETEIEQLVEQAIAKLAVKL